MKSWIAITAVFFVNTGCISKMISAAIPQKGMKADEVQRVKTVAIVAFDVLQYQPTGVAGRLSGHVATAQTMQHMEAVDTELAAELYEDLAKTLAARGWKVLPRDKMTGNSVYAAFFAKKKGTLMEKMPNHFQKPTTVSHVMRPINPVYMFTAAERAELAKALGVDAVVMARVSYHTEQKDFTGLGVGSIYLKPILAFNMFSATSESQIWFDYGFTGPRSEESLGHVSGMEDEGKIAEFSRPLAQQAFSDFAKTQ